MMRRGRRKFDSPERLRTIAACKSQAEFEREQREAYLARVVKVAKDNPYLPLEALAERFGDTVPAMRKILCDAKVPRQTEYLTQAEMKRLGVGSWRDQSRRRVG